MTVPDGPHLHQQGADVSLIPQVQISHQLLRGCRHCGTKHPLAHKPVPAVIDRCKGCGQPIAGPDDPVVVEGKFTGGPAIWFANLLLAIAAWLRRH